MAPAPPGSELADAARFDDLHLTFRRTLGSPVPALRGFSLEVKRGEVVGLLGPNGAGKSTALGCLLGLLRPDRGTLSRLGRPVSTAGRGADQEQTGVLLEETRLPPFLSVRQVLETVCAVRGLGRARGKEELDRIVQTYGIAELLERRAGILSKGQARKVGLAAALVADPRLLVLDEPSAGLDVAVRIEFEQMLRKLNDGKRTVIIASHLLGEVETACTHLAVVVEGRVVLKGRTQELLERAGAGGRSQVHVEATSSTELDRLGLRYQTSRHPGLLLVISEQTDQELFALLAQAGVVPKLVEPPANLASFYLEIVASQADKSRQEAGDKG